MILGAALTVPVAEAVGACTRTLALSSPTTALRVDPSLRDAKGTIDVVVQLPDAPLAGAMSENALREGGGLNRAQQVAYSAKITAAQNALSAKIAALGGKEVGRVRIAYNAILVRIDSKQAEPARVAARRVGDSASQRLPARPE